MKPLMRRPSILRFVVYISLFTVSLGGCALGPRWSLVVPKYDASANDMLVRIGGDLHVVHLVHSSETVHGPGFPFLREEEIEYQSPVLDLFAAMLLRKEIAGYRRVIDPEVSWRVHGPLAIRKRVTYEGAEYIGKEIEVRNRMPLPYWLQPDLFAGEHVYAVLLTDRGWRRSGRTVPRRVGRAGMVLQQTRTVRLTPGLTTR